MPPTLFHHQGNFASEIIQFCFFIMKTIYPLGLCYFTAISTNQKVDFMKELNNSYRYACLQCSFTDNQLSEYLQYKRRKTGAIPVNYAVSHMQEDGMWVLGDTYITPEGKLMEVQGSKYVWIGGTFKGPRVVDDSQNCCISRPLTTEPLQRLLQSLKRIMKHNFIPCILTMAGKYLYLQHMLLSSTCIVLF